MTVIDDIGSSFSNFGWSSLGSILVVFIIFTAFIVLVAVTGFFLWYKQFNIKVTVFRPYGRDLTEEELQKLRNPDGKITQDSLKSIRFEISKKRKTKGRFILSKGNPYFKLLTPLRNLEPIPIDYIYPEGVYLIQLARNFFFPIPKPVTILSVGEDVTLNLSDTSRWTIWNNTMAEKIAQRFTDPDKEKRITLFFVIGIAAMVIIGGFILWLIYKSVQKGQDITPMINAWVSKIQQSSGGGPPPA